MFSEHFIIKSKWSRSRLELFYNEFFNEVPIEISEEYYSQGTKYNHSNGILEVSLDWGHDIIEGLIHEMAHIAEISEDRLFLNNYGFGEYKMGSGFGNSHRCKPAFERELRVFAYEWAICKYLRKRFCRHTFSFGMEMVVTTSSPYSSPYSLVQQRSIIQSEFQGYKKIYTIDKFKEEWNKKVRILKESLNDY